MRNLQPQSGLDRPQKFSTMPVRRLSHMKSVHSKWFIGLLLAALIVCAVGCGMFGMFKPHDYDWSTGQPTLKDQVTAFQQAEKRWPKDYDDLVAFMKQSNSKFVPTSYDRIDFTTNSDGNLEIVVYVFDSGFTNHMILKK
jgi:hypothetical protein